MTALPTRHLSARVPWHDNKWNGRTCKKVTDNSFCRILPRIDGEKNPDEEPEDCLIDESVHAPCLSEKGTFLSPHECYRELKHAWKDINTLFKEFRNGSYCHKPYSINAIPFLWMMKNRGTDKSPHFSEKADLYGLNYSPDLEAEMDQKLGFEGNIWVQHPENQKALLDGFFNCLKPQVSLIFFYCKHTPLSDPNERIIVGVAKVRSPIGPIMEYSFPDGYTGHRSHPWDRCVEHSLTDTREDGFLLPYHDLLAFAAANNLEQDLREYVSCASDFFQFSYASELVEHDVAIDSLLRIAESLKKIGRLLSKEYTKELAWLDNEMSKIWDMRGAFPGIGPVLTSLKMAEGNTIAWEIERHLQERDGDLLGTNPWTIFEESLEESEKYITDRGRRLFSPTNKLIWSTLSEEKKEYFKLLSRCQLNNDQAKYIIENCNPLAGSPAELSVNLYLLYEKTRFYLNGLSFEQIDKAILPPEKIRNAFPLPEIARLETGLDRRRARALTVRELESAAGIGHSLLGFDEALTQLSEVQLSEAFPVHEDLLQTYLESDFFKEEIDTINSKSDNPLRFLKLSRLGELKKIIRRRVDLEKILRRPYDLNREWQKDINNWQDFETLDPANKNYQYDILARKEKAEALKIITNYKFSVLIGPAGSGKTTLLKIFENLPEIQSEGVLKLAPTGKARVKLGKDAQTIAQFLNPLRYDGETGVYHPAPGERKYAEAKNIIIDEASMLTEEQLAALFDALGAVKRIILVGDYRQLPPIGTGRPFVDIVNEIRPDQFENPSIHTSPAYAELKHIMRQTEDGAPRVDLLLSRCFGGSPSKDDLDLFKAVADGNVTSPNLRLEKWYEGADFREIFQNVLIEELCLDSENIEKSFNTTIGATTDENGYQYFNVGKSEKIIEQWQVISPINGYAHGVKEINKLIQGKFRRSFVDLAINKKTDGMNYPPKRRIAKPKGADNIVYGDKVISLRNTRWKDRQWIKPRDMKPTALNYFANGEIGIITGEFRGHANKRKNEPNIEIAFSTQPGYSYVFWPNNLTQEGTYSFELAYAITVHKSQGSGFKKLFFVLPSGSPVLCRELLYTALTRQEEKIIIFHQGDFRDFLRLASTEASATARRQTDLFHLPDLIQLNKKWYDTKYINVSERGEPMISKNEVIIANSLNKYRDRIDYAYEDKLILGTGGRTIKPDFAIENFETGRRFYWEHLGMMTKTEYREKWQKKLQGYLDDGFVLHTNASFSDENVLIVTEENPNGGINSQDIDHVIRKVILEE